MENPRISGPSLGITTKDGRNHGGAKRRCVFFQGQRSNQAYTTTAARTRQSTTENYTPMARPSAIALPAIVKHMPCVEAVNGK